MRSMRERFDVIFERSKRAKEHPQILIKPLKLKDCASDHRLPLVHSFLLSHLIIQLIFFKQSQLLSFSSTAFPNMLI
ncbi:hypothetical protein MTR67_053247 [Solanum verrucosum]|uniref:Uncharacterized protein n=1 Tax=Solanum verrucosum TaxID=315347 RepID=A0AAF0V8J2_SOLVR|nr:hypothetical protein MTR67_053247 [Solanum verrucosum]